MEKKTLYALVIVAVLGAGAFFAMRAPEKGERVGPPPRPIPAIKSTDVAHLEITNDKQEKVVLDKKGEDWRVTSPHDWPADKSGVKSLTDGLEKLGFGDIVTESKDKLKDLGVEDGKAAHLVAKNASGAVLADFLVGKAISGFTMVRPTGKDEVWQATGLYGYMINRAAKDWRDHTIFNFTAADASKLTITSPGGELALEKEAPAKDKDKKDKTPPAATGWKIADAKGDAPKTSDQLDAELATQAVQALSTLRASDFADDQKPAELGLDKPRLTVAVTADAKTYTLLVGNAKNDDLFVKTKDEPTLYLVKKYAFDRVDHPPIDYRDKTIAKVKDSDLASIDLTYSGEKLALTHDGNDWKAKGKKLDDGKVKAFASAFESLSGAGFVESPDLAKLGFKKPTGEVTLHLKDKSTIALKVGALSPDGSEYYVQKEGSPEVLRVKKYLVERFLKKPADLGLETKVAQGEKKGKKK